MQYIEGRPLDEILEELRRLRDVAGRGADPPTERMPPEPGFPGGSEVAGEADDSSGAPAASSSSLLSDPHRPFAKSVAHLGVQVADALEYAERIGASTTSQGATRAHASPVRGS
jgi:hypothetical protein